MSQPPFEAEILMDRRRLKRRLSIWRFIAILFLIFSTVSIIGLFVDDIPEDHVARLDVGGVIIENDRRQKIIDEIHHDDTAKAVLVYINSPGGSTFGSERLYKALRRVAADKPVVTVIGTIGASGGYMTALAGDRIFSGESSITGSIGVILQLTEFSELMKNLGIRAQSVTSGPLKGEPSPFKPLSPAARANLKDMIDQTHDWFVNLVAERRPLTNEQAGKLADGRIFIGLRAIEQKLIDEIGGIREARSWLSENRDIATSLPLLKRDYSEPESLIERLLSSVVGKSVISERLTLDGLVSLWHPD